MSFYESVTTYRSVYFHFLDGLLNTTSEGTFEDVLKTLHKITPGLLPRDINFVNLKFEDKNILFTTGPIVNYSIKYEFDENDLSETPKPYILQPDHLNLDYFNFCIFPINFNKHQTTTIIFKKLNKLYLFDICWNMAYTVV